MATHTVHHYDLRDMSYSQARGAWARAAAWQSPPPQRAPPQRQERVAAGQSRLACPLACLSGANVLSRLEPHASG